MLYDVKYVINPIDLERSHLTDLEIVDGFLIGTTRYDGGLVSWSLDGKLTRLDDHLYEAGPILGGEPNFTVLSDRILIGESLQAVTLEDDGKFSTIAVSGDFDHLQYGVVTMLENDKQVVYGILRDGDGIGRIDFDMNAPTEHHEYHTTSKIASLALGAVDSVEYIFTADTDNNVSSYVIGIDGALSITDTITAEDGLWISTPTALSTVVMSGETYVIVAAAGSSSLSVMQVGPDGSLTIREHLLDTLSTRFSGVAAMEVITYSGQTYVIAGGVDDGISIFQMLEGGQLIARGHLADTTNIGLTNISDIAVRGSGAGLDIFIASSNEFGVTQLRFDTGDVGITITATDAGGIIDGTHANDILQGLNGDDNLRGGAGDDILRDFDGSDILTGGAGADIFVLSADSVTDTITDFTLGEDKIDLSSWAFLRDINQLTMTLRDDGFLITYGDEELIVQSDSGQTIDYRLLETSDLLGGMRIPGTIVTGYPGPATPKPETTPTNTLVPETGADPTRTPVVHSIVDLILHKVELMTSGGDEDGFTATSGDDVLFTTSGILSGQSGNDLLFGNAENNIMNGDAGIDSLFGGDGRDELHGGDGVDLLNGGKGNDVLYGDDGADFLYGGAGADKLFGGNQSDNLDGGDGADILDGGWGNDTLFGGAGADTFIFFAGQDEILDFEQGSDEIAIDPILWTGLTSAQDLLYIYGRYDDGTVTLDLESGNVLTIHNVSDYDTFAANISLL